MKRKGIILLILISLYNAEMFGQQTSSSSDRVIKVDYNKTAGKLNTMFKECIGAGRANEGLRAD